MGPIRSPSGESARHEDAQKRLISATAAAQKRRVGGLAYESPAALRGWRSGEQAGTCSAVLGAAGESRERGRGWPPRAAKAKYRTIFSTGEATRRSNGPGQPREAAPRKSRRPRNAYGGFRKTVQRDQMGRYKCSLSLVGKDCAAKENHDGHRLQGSMLQPARRLPPQEGRQRDATYTYV